MRGKLLGGSSSINGMVFVRGNAKDFDGWAEAGLNEWSYDKVLPYFKKMEDFDGGPDEYRAAGGPLRITTSQAKGRIFEAYLEAGRQYGLAYNPDYNGRVQEGVHKYQATIDAGTRGSTDHAYLRTAAGRDNLQIMTNAVATRIVFDGNAATGVKLDVGGKTVNVTARQEVILSAGAYQSPHLLMHSGIGDADHLREIGIDLVVHLPGVGQNLQDHPCVALGYTSRVKGVSPAVGMSLFRKAKIGAEWLFRKQGLGTSNFWETGAFFKSSDTAGYADIQHEFIPMIGDFTHGSQELGDGFLYQVCLMRPRSRGRLRLASANPKAAPDIFHNYLSHPDDLRDLREGVRRTEDMIAQPAWDSIRSSEWGTYRAGMTDDELESWIRHTASTQYHPCGTCAMGSDELAVTDQQGRVRGVNRLRVIDASILPAETSGNLNGPTIMAAEKLSDDVLGGR